ncbi:MAG: hypothetical protein Q9184_008480, partial [Pyrenodesmia sp. 2 TL-2023]
IHLREQDQRLAAESVKAEAGGGGGGGGSGGGGGGAIGGGFTVTSREMGTQAGGAAAGAGSTDTEAMLANVSRDGNPAYVSLG